MSEAGERVLHSFIWAIAILGAIYFFRGCISDQQTRKLECYKLNKNAAECDRGFGQ